MAYQGSGGSGDYEDDHRLRDLPRGNVRSKSRRLNFYSFRS